MTTYMYLLALNIFGWILFENPNKLRKEHVETKPKEWLNSILDDVWNVAVLKVNQESNHYTGNNYQHK